MFFNYKEWIKESMQKNVDKCNGKVTNITMIKEDRFSNKFDGYVEVKVREKKLLPRYNCIGRWRNIIL